MTYIDDGSGKLHDEHKPGSGAYDDMMVEKESEPTLNLKDNPVFIDCHNIIEQIDMIEKLIITFNQQTRFIKKERRGINRADVEVLYEAILDISPLRQELHVIANKLDNLNSLIRAEMGLLDL